MISVTVKIELHELHEWTTTSANSRMMVNWERWALLLEQMESHRSIALTDGFAAHKRISMSISVVLELPVQCAGIGTRRGRVPVAGVRTTWSGNRVGAENEHVHRTHADREHPRLVLCKSKEELEFDTTSMYTYGDATLYFSYEWSTPNGIICT